jgi:acyl transferase domain-containing protein/acyl carrier protein
MEGNALELRLHLQPHEGDKLRFKFQTVSGGELAVHAQGLIERAQAAAEDPAEGDLHHWLRRCSAELRVEDCQRLFESVGFFVGPAMRALKELRTGRDSAGPPFILARLEVPPDTPAPSSHVLHPAVVDGALQASIGLRMTGGEGTAAPPTLTVPFAVDSVEVLGPSPTRGFALLRPSVASSQCIQKLDLDLFDENGRRCFRMRGYSVRVAKRHGPGDLLLLTPTKVEVQHDSTPLEAADCVHWVIDAGTDAARAAGDMHEAARSCLAGARYVALHTERGDLAGTYIAQARTLLHHLQTLLRDEPSKKARLHLIVESAGDASLAIGLSAMLKAARLEHPRLSAQTIVLSPGLSSSQRAILLAGALQKTASEMVWPTPERTRAAAWRELPLEPSSPVWKDNGVYLITGGAGGLGRSFARAIVENAAAPTIVLIGRTAQPYALDELSKIAERQGARIEYRCVDVADPTSVGDLVHHIVGRYGALNGVIHAAGTLSDGHIAGKTGSELELVMASKVRGAVNLDSATRGLKLDFLVLFSSLAGAFGSAGQADYAAANGFLDAFAAWRNALLKSGERHGFTTSINWPYWADGGMRADAEAYQRARQRLGMVPLPTEVGMTAFARALASGESQVLVAFGDVERLKQSFVPDNHDLAAPAPAERRTARAPDSSEIEAVLRRALSSLLKFEEQDIDPDIEFAELGLDSVALVELTTQLRSSHSLDLSPTTFFEFTTLRALAQHVATIWQPSHAPAKEALSAANGLLGPEAAAHAPPIDLAPQATSAPEAAGKLLSRPTLERAAGINRAVAIIGLAGRFPQADNVEALWQNLIEGRDCITEIPKTRWDHSRYFDPKKGKAGASYSKWGGFLSDIESFDPLFFNIAPKDAERIQPQERLFLETVWELLERSGYTRADLHSRYGRKVGVYVGAMVHQYGSFERDRSAPIPEYSTIANRVSYFLGVQGPSIDIDTLCSSSAIAIHLACKDLLSGECRLAIAGGSNLTIHPSKYVGLSQGGFAGSDPASRSFMAGDGYLPGECVGAVLLKPLEQAAADGDRILAVIRATAINHGGRSNGYAAPNLAAQSAVVAEALSKAAIEPKTVSYVEAAANGSSLGDAIEVEALRKTFVGCAPQCCAIGSIKSNIGHPEAASGIAQLAKVVLQLRHGILAPSLVTGPLNPAIRFEETPFRLQREAGPWERGWLNGAEDRSEQPRRAIITSFGAGGANACLVIEEHATHHEVAPRPDHRHRILPFSARNSDRLRELVERMLAFAERRPLPDFADFAFSLHRREALPSRLAIMAATWSEAIGAMQAFVGAPGPATHGCEMFRGEGTDAVAQLASGDEGAALVDALLGASSLHKLALLWANGGAVQLDQLDKGSGRLCDLPTYPFARDRYWLSTARDAPWSVDTVAKASDGIMAGLTARERNGARDTGDFIAEFLGRGLRLEPHLIRRDQDLMDYGVDSTLITQLLQAIGDTFGVRVSRRQLLENQTVGGLTQLVERGLALAPERADLPTAAVAEPESQLADTLERFGRGDLDIEAVERLIAAGEA